MNEPREETDTQVVGDPVRIIADRIRIAESSRGPNWLQAVQGGIAALDETIQTDSDPHRVASACIELANLRMSRLGEMLDLNTGISFSSDENRREQAITLLEKAIR